MATANLRKGLTALAGSAMAVLFVGGLLYLVLSIDTGDDGGPLAVATTQTDNDAGETPLTTAPMAVPAMRFTSLTGVRRVTCFTRQTCGATLLVSYRASTGTTPARDWNRLTSSFVVAKARTATTAGPRDGHAIDT